MGKGPSVAPSFHLLMRQGADLRLLLVLIFLFMFIPRPHGVRE